MKTAILTTEADARALQSADDKAGNLPWPGVYLDGRKAPAGEGVTLHRYDVTTKPDGKAYAFPVEDSAASKTPGDALSKATIVDALDATWAAKAEEPVKEEPAEEPIDLKGK
jgi:hypothetical protein